MATGRLNAARTEAENVKTAALAYYADYSQWPASQPAQANGDIYNGTTRMYINKWTIGSYTWDGNGVLTGSGYGTTGFGWLSDNQTWTK